MPTADGLTPAIADIDDDGHNELILGSLNNIGDPPEFPSIWVVDFSNGHPEIVHGAILWGQFASDGERSGRAVDMVQKAALNPTLLRATVEVGSLLARNLAIGNHGGILMHWSAVGVEQGESACTTADPVDWITFSESAGDIHGGHDHVISVRIDARGMQVGSHRADICILTDDPAHRELAIPVEIEVSRDTIFFDGFDG